MVERLKSWWGADAFRRWVIIGAFIYAYFFTQGFPLWDDDYTSWLWKTKDHSIFYYLFEWISPVSSQPQYWGFNERPLEALFFKVGHLISGYHGWSYFLMKNCIFALLAGMLYTWALRLVPKTEGGKRAALVATVFFVLAPGPLASHILLQDFAPAAELIFLAVTYLIWEEIEKTPVEWSGIPKWSDPAQKKWVLKWLGIAFLTYLGYKSKADLKIIPLILAGYVFLLRRKQIGFFAVPVAAMLILAVPYGPKIFSQLPPFIPGSKGSDVAWMWQPASFGRMRDFLWASYPYNFLDSLKSSTISLSGILGPFLLIGVIAFLATRIEALDKIQWKNNATRLDRSRTFALVWFAGMLSGVAALPSINYTFQIRYGILLLVPTSLLLAWVFGYFAEAKSRLPKWAMVTGVALLAIQMGINLNRSISYRRDIGQVLFSVSDAYELVDQKFPNDKLALFPDFRPYDFHPNASPALTERTWLASNDDLAKKFSPNKTTVISWAPSLWEQLELVEHFSGCHSGVIFDILFRCPPGSGTNVMRFIGADPLYAQGEALRSKGDLAGAKKIHEEFLSRHPSSLAGQFVIGLEAFNLKDWMRSEQMGASLEQYFPDHLGIVYNHALALSELKKYPEAIERLKYVAAKEPGNYAAQINLYWNYTKNDQPKKAKNTLAAMKEQFPNDKDVNRLLATQAN